MIRHLYISIQQQRLFYFDNGKCVESFVISTAKNGVGEIANSYCTPSGWHSIADIIGRDAPIKTVFKARQPTGQTYSAELEQLFPDQDWILTRIIRLAGKEIGFNQGGNCDTYQRCIYIHGCADKATLGTPDSHGCIRMANQDIIRLVGFVRFGDSVFIG